MNIENLKHILHKDQIHLTSKYVSIKLIPEWGDNFPELVFSELTKVIMILSYICKDDSISWDCHGDDGWNGMTITLTGELKDEH